MFIKKIALENSRQAPVATNRGGPRLLASLFLAIFSAVVHPSQFTISDADFPSPINLEEVPALIRDQNGLLWIGTSHGLFRYDGVSILSFGIEYDGAQYLPSNSIQDLPRKEYGGILVSSKDGRLHHFNKTNQRFETVSKFGDNRLETISDILVSTSGRIWLTNREQIVLLDHQLNFLFYWKLGGLEDNPAPYATSVVEVENDSILLGTERGFIKIDPISKQMERFRLRGLPSSASVYVTTIYRLDNDHLIIGTNTGDIAIVRQENLSITRASSVSSFGASRVNNFLVSDSKILIASDNGIFQSNFDLESIQDVSHFGKGVSSRDVRLLQKDGDNIWISTFAGLNVASFSDFETYRTSRQGRTDEPMTFVEDVNDKLWVGTFSGLYRYSPEEQSHVEIDTLRNSRNANQLASRQITALEFSGSKLWIGYFESGVQTFDVKSKVVRDVALNDLDKVAVPDILSLEQFGEVWIATFRNGLFRITDENTESFLQSGKLNERFIYSLIELNDGSILTISASRIYIFDRGRSEFEELVFDYGTNGTIVNVLSAIEADNGDIWFGSTHHGLFRWPIENQQRGKMKVEWTKIPEGFRHILINAIELDNDGNIWASTNRGILKLDHSGRFLARFSIHDGLQGDTYTGGVSYKARDGALYFGGTNGYNKFYPDQIEIDTTPPRTVLSAAHFPERSFINIPAPQDEVTFQITHKDRYVTFDFSVSDFVGYQENQFRYKLEGFDPDWREIGYRNSATYTSLPSGNYVLRAQGANAAGIWDPDGLHIPIRVLPPPWKSWWAYSLYSLAGLLAIWLAHRAYQSYVIERRAEELAEEMLETLEYAENEMQEQLELQDELLKSAYDHKRDTLDLVGTVVQATESDHGDFLEEAAHGSAKMVHALSLLEDCIMYGADGASANLNQFVELLFPEICRKAGFDEQRLILINELPTVLIPAPSCSTLAVIINELLENCVQHAFAADSPVNYIHIELQDEFDKEQLRSIFTLTIKDDGMGAPGDLFDDPPPESGAATILAILARYDGSVTLDTSSGTRISITLPESRSSFRA